MAGPCPKPKSAPASSPICSPTERVSASPRQAVQRVVRTTRPVDPHLGCRRYRQAGMDQIVLLAPQGQVVCERCEVVDGFLRRGLGLLGRKRLPRGQGLLIKPSWSIHTWFMHFPIDVVFLDRELRVLEIRKQMRPWRVTARFRAHSALELPAGECDRLRLGVGDRLAWGSLQPAP